MESMKTFVKGFHNETECSKMKYLPFGKTGLMLSKLSVGGAVFGKHYGVTDQNEAKATILKAIQSGINYLDTAPWYGQGQSEKLIGEALVDIPRSAYYIATKVGRYELDYENMFDFSAKKTRQSVENSLKLLGLDYVDIIQIHDIEFAPSLDYVIKETLPELELIVKEGKAKFIGVTGYPLSILKDIVLAAPGRFDMVLTYARYTLLDRSLEEYISFFQEQELGIVSGSGHALGLLTNAGPPIWHPAPLYIKDMCIEAVKICKNSNIDLAKLAMYFCTRLEGPSTFLTGMQTRIQLSCNLDATYNGLKKKEAEVLDHLMETIFMKSVNWEAIELEKYHNKFQKK